MREMDPRYQQYNQQIPVGMDYWQAYQQSNAENAARQQRVLQQIGENQAQSEIAKIQKGSAWIGGLDSALNKGMQGFNTAFNVGMQKAKFKDDQATSASQRALNMEQMLGAQQRRELDAMYGVREREAGLEQTRAGTRATEMQTKGQETQNAIQDLQRKKAEVQALYENSDASKLGFPDAVPEENVAQYVQRMEVLGKKANADLARSQADQIRQQIEMAPKEFEHKMKIELGQLQVSKMNAAVNQGQLAVQKAQFQQQSEQYNRGEFERQLAEFAKGVQSGAIPIPQGITPAQFIQAKAQQLAQWRGISGDPSIASAQALGTAQSAAAQAKVAATVAAQNDPSQKTVIEMNQKQAALLTGANDLIDVINREIETLQGGVGYVWNSPEAQNAAARIEAKLDQVAAQEPSFRPFLEQFRNINASLSSNPLQALKNVASGAFGPKQADVLEQFKKNMSATILGAVKANPVLHPSMAPLVQQLMNSYETKVNMFFKKQMKDSNNSYPQQQQAPNNNEMYYPNYNPNNNRQGRMHGGRQ